MSKIDELTKKVHEIEKVVETIKTEVLNLAKLETGAVFNPDFAEWVDLGLPSGRLWAKENAPGYYDWDKAKEIFKDCLPSASAMAELYEECDWDWDDSKKGYIVTGPNGNSIFLPALGYKDTDGDINCTNSGYYWTTCPSKTSQTNARYLNFNSGDIYPLNSNYRSYGFSVRPSREK
ncbi:MAG: hypothetical protein IK114_05020 [Fibrobacter sp.]|nr:hypothetical protein [Fibrobacter sp.]